MSRRSGGTPERRGKQRESERDGIETAILCGVEVPILNWCRECWDEIAPPEDSLPDECPDCGSTNVTRL